jgi:hypothetical protein
MIECSTLNMNFLPPAALITTLGRCVTVTCRLQGAAKFSTPDVRNPLLMRDRLRRTHRRRVRYQPGRSSKTMRQAWCHRTLVEAISAIGCSNQEGATQLARGSRQLITGSGCLGLYRR